MMMTQGLLQSLQQQFNHLAWANARLVESLRRLSDAEFTRVIGPGLDSVCIKLTHAVDAEWIWLHRIATGLNDGDRPDNTRFKSLAAFLRWMAEVDAIRSTYAAGLTESELVRIVEYTNYAGVRFAQPVREILQHMLMHAAYHRGQAVSGIRALGKQPPETDLIIFQRQ
jgi:uncharacterized damage-inducible protein DinB